MSASLVPHALFYAGHYGALGVLLPFFSLFLRHQGRAPEEIGLLLSLPAASMCFAPVIAGYLADRWGRPRALLRISLLTAAGALLLLPRAGTLLETVSIVGVYAVALAPVVPLADAQALRAVGGEGGRYARVRLFGSIGFVSTAVGLGWLLEGGLPVAHVPSIAAWAVLVAFLGTLGFPPAPLGGPPLRIREAAELWGDLRVRHLLIACLIHWAAMSPYHSLFALHVGGLGLSSGVTGLAMAVGAAAEVLVMASALRWIGRGSTRGWLIGAFLVSAARWALTAVVRDPWILAAIQAFHAFSFGVFYLSAVQALVRWVPDRLRATGQGLFGAAVFGVGGWIGTAAGGLIFDRLGGRALFGLSACAACLAAAWAARIAATEEG